MKNEIVEVTLSRSESLALRGIAFRAGASLEATVRAILQNAAGVTHTADSLNARVVDAAATMPVIRRRAA